MNSYMKKSPRTCFLLITILILLTLCACSKNVQMLPEQGKSIVIRLQKATEYETVEVFGKIVNSARGVTSAKRYRSNIDPEDPENCIVVWRITLEDTDPFRLEANIMKRVNDLLDAGGKTTINGIKYNYTPAEINLLKGLRPTGSTSSEISFIIDLQLSQEREMSDRHDPYNPR